MDTEAVLPFAGFFFWELGLVQVGGGGISLRDGSRIALRVAPHDVEYVREKISDTGRRAGRMVSPARELAIVHM
jgi:hypothetical protein